MENFRPRSLGTGAAGTRQRGSILILTLALSGLMAMLALSFSQATSNIREISRDGSTHLQAELAAQSALDFARRQLLLDASWDGNDPGGVLLSGDIRFVIERLDEPLGPAEEQTAELVLHGYMGEAEFTFGVEHRLATTLHVTPGNFLRTMALVVIGYHGEFEDVTISGDAIIADVENKVYDWDPTMNGGEGGYKLGGPHNWSSGSKASGPDWQYDFDNSGADETLYKFDSSNTYTTGIEKISEESVYMPTWNLDDYLVPGVDRVIYNNISQLKNIVLDETAVVVLDPGRQLLLENVELRGGLVVWVESDYDLRDWKGKKDKWPHRNKIKTKGDIVVGGGAAGIHPSIGLIAPACLIEMESGDPGSGGKSSGKKGKKGGGGAAPTQFRGLTFVGAMKHKKGIYEFDGQLIVINEIRKLRSTSLLLDEVVTESPPPGIQYHGDRGMVTVMEVREEFDPVGHPPQVEPWPGDPEAATTPIPSDGGGGGAPIEDPTTREPLPLEPVRSPEDPFGETTIVPTEGGNMLIPQG